MKAIVADRGQVTIPKKIRDRLGIKPKMVLDFHAEDGRLIAVKHTEEDRFTNVRGCLKLQETTDEIIKSMRGG